MNINTERVNFQRGISSYFGNIILTKCKEIPNSSFAIYYGRVGCLLCIDDRYVVAIVGGDNHNQIGHQTHLSNLNWTSFQTRTISKPLRELKTQTVQSQLNEFVTSKINLIEKRDDRYVYFSDNVPVRVELLFTKENESYAEFGTIQSALETYNCVLSFTM